MHCYHFIFKNQRKKIERKNSHENTNFNLVLIKIYTSIYISIV